MKHLILASIFCLAFAITLSAQAPIKVVPQIIPLPPNIGVWSVVRGIKTPVLLAPRELKVRRSDAPGGVCSVPLLGRAIQPVACLEQACRSFHKAA
jgi:hypothetical protein